MGLTSQEEWERIMGRGYLPTPEPPATGPTDAEIRLTALSLAVEYDRDAGIAVLMDTARLFADFLAGK